MNTQARIERFILDDLLSGTSRKAIGLDEPLVSSGLIDSLALLRLIGFLEQEFELTIGDGEVELDNWNTIRQMVAFVEKKATR